MRNERHSQRLLGNINVLPDSHRRAIHVTSGLDTLYLAANLFCKGINPIEIVDRPALAFPVLVEKTYVLLFRVEEEAGDGLAIIVIKEDGAIVLGVAHCDSGRIYFAASDSLDDAVCGDLFLCSHDPVIVGFGSILRSLAIGTVFSGRGHLDIVGAECGFQPVVHLIGEETLQCLFRLAA